MHIRDARVSVFLLQGRVGQKKKFLGGAGQGREQNPLGGAGQQLNSGHFRSGAALKIFGAMVVRGSHFPRRASLQFSKCRKCRR